MSKVTTTIMYVLRKKALMNKFEKLRNFFVNNGLIANFYSPYGGPWTSCTQMGFWPISNMTLT